jgi:photosystem II stability/assembly factor-like uncharacterized protein
LSQNVYLSVGTHKGGFLLISNQDRKQWQMHGPFFKGEDVNHMILDTRGEPTLYACINSSWWGPDVRISLDFGKTWVEPEKGIRFEEGSDFKVKKVWHVLPGREDEKNVLYAGVDPAALFKSEDAGKSWNDLIGLTDHPTRNRWAPGLGGLMVHSVCLHPTDKLKMHVGISAAGHFYSENGGKTWQPRNKGVLADFLPEKYPEVGQCVHHMEIHPTKPETLYQQNHCGVYRSDTGGLDWIDISEGLPSRFGFPLQIHPHDPDTIYVIPEEGPDFRCPINGEFSVYRSRDRGSNWEKLTKGLPNQNAYIHVFRQALTVDNSDSAGIYVGTSTGQIFYSTNEGDTWQTLVNYLPPVFSLSCSVV